MPLPRGLARFNRLVTNRLTRPVASRAPGFAVVIHVGRRSGRVYRTPVNVFRDDGRYVFALTYGRNSEWVRNVLAAGRCEIETRGKLVRLADPVVVTDVTRRRVPSPARWILGALSVDDFLVLTPRQNTPE